MKTSYYPALFFIFGILIVFFSLFRECYQASDEDAYRELATKVLKSPSKPNNNHQSTSLRRPVQLPLTSPPTALASVSNSESDNSDKVQSRIEELMLLGMKDDMDSLKTICAELTNSQKEIRLSAADALVQFGDASVVPQLRNLAIQAKDPQEQAHFNEAAEQLSLPSFTELRKLQQGKNQH